ncbi:DNA mismatch repair protein MutL [Planctomycetes bacterium Pla163]|uniref:DNA mismatch repair protein MutL n=1 Tax=Rohdeia mirabilis TaxID=2528008 RepID=A0A518D1J2_9BACT|nr:DNA mismatch repair protein MutL [Planctomycetes bacterium Pla163]
MTTRIRELPELVKNQIAAGEVVERPSSALKELVENSLDAGATQVRVDLEEGGTKLVRIVDDGCGMGPEDLEMCFRPHATSKLHELEDLDHIASLGFRGEAMASIGSVARVRVLTRPADSATGWCIENEGGRISAVREAGCPKGTTIEVRDLFFNTPARRRFLKTERTELSRCLDLLQRLALAQLGVGFVATHGDRRLYDVDADMDLRARVRRTFGAELADALVDVEVQHGTLGMRGLVAPPRFSRRDASRQMWFLNGRPLRDKLLSRVLKEGYRGFLEEGRQPAAFLALEMDPALVDVNVHPTKSEVRFRDERALFGWLVPRLREAVARTDIATPGESLLHRVERRGDWRPASGAPDPNQAWLPAGERPYELRPSAPRAESDDFARDNPFGSTSGYDVPTPRGAPASNDEAWRARDRFDGPFLQIDRTYLVRALPDGFEIVDQHALHERVTLEGLRDQLREGAVEVQRLLVPEVVELARDEVKLVESELEGLARLGIELSIFGPTTVAVQGLPALLRNPDAVGVVRDVVGFLSMHGELPQAEDVVEEVLHRTACRSSIMAGDALEQDQIRALLERAEVLENSQTCPHARPTRVKFTLADLEKAFHRR